MKKPLAKLTDSVMQVVMTTLIIIVFGLVLMSIRIVMALVSFVYDTIVLLFLVVKYSYKFVVRLFSI